MTMATNRIISLTLLSIGGVVMLWSAYGAGLSRRILVEPLSSMTMGTASNVGVDFSNRARVQVQSSSLRLQAKPAPKEPFGASQKRSLLRIDNDSKGEDKVHDETKMLPVPILLNQILYGPNKKLNDGINRGLHDVGIFLLGWFVVMCAIGGVMRCYICCEHIQSGSFNIRSLYDSFADRELVAPTEDEEEGIALGSTHGTMNSESDYD